MKKFLFILILVLSISVSKPFIMPVYTYADTASDVLDTDANQFEELEEKIKKAGSSGYNVLLSIIKIGLFISILMTGWMFLFGGSKDTAEGKKQLLKIAVASIFIFGSAWIYNTLSSMFSSL
ncbi:hypothetical protein WG909_14585 [Peptostreptococcaceae bacterium AGR-M142]